MSGKSIAPEIWPAFSLAAILGPTAFPVWFCAKTTNSAFAFSTAAAINLDKAWSFASDKFLQTQMFSAPYWPNARYTIH